MQNQKQYSVCGLNSVSRPKLFESQLIEDVYILKFYVTKHLHVAVMQK